MEMNERDKRVEEIARACHEVNRGYCRALGDDSQPAWEEAPDWQQESARSGVRFHLSDPTLTPEKSHAEWSRHKIADGWVFGETKDPEKKTHPCLVEYSELPKSQRLKDYLFKAVVDGLR